MFNTNIKLLKSSQVFEQEQNISLKRNVRSEKQRHLEKHSLSRFYLLKLWNYLILFGLLTLGQLNITECNKSVTTYVAFSGNVQTQPNN